MDVTELSNDASMRSYIEGIVRDPRFPALKDAFVAHTPGGEREGETGVAVAQGKFLGTRFVFNTMESISRTKPDKKPTGPIKHGTKDPDLSDDT